MGCFLQLRRPRRDGRAVKGSSLRSYASDNRLFQRPVGSMCMTVGGSPGGNDNRMSAVQLNSGQCARGALIAL